MNIELRPLAEIIPYEQNPRVTDQAVDAVAESIRRFGFPPSGARFVFAAASFLSALAEPRRRWALLMWMRLPVAVFVAFHPSRLCTLSIRTDTSQSLTLAMYRPPTFTSLFFMAFLLGFACRPMRRASGAMSPSGRRSLVLIDDPQTDESARSPSQCAARERILAGAILGLAYNLGNFLRRLALPRSVRHWSLTTLREKLIKIGAKAVTHSKLCDLSNGGGGGAA